MTETVVEFAPGAQPGVVALRRQAVECGGTSDRRGDELALWTTAEGQPTWAMRSSGTTTVAVTFTGNGLDRRRQPAVMQLAFTKAVRSQS